MTKRNQNEEIWEGEYHTIPVSVVDGAAVAVNITGATLTWRMSTVAGVTVLTKTIGSGITVVSASAGTILITLAASDTVALGGITYLHELVVTDSSGHPEVGFVGVISINQSAVL